MMTSQRIVFMMFFALIAGCASIHESEDYRRHTLSQLAAPMDGGDFYWFDVTVTPEMPDESEAAEAVRMEWVSAWLESRRLCPNGYSIIERRPFEFLEHNPADHDLRYKVRCK